MRVLIAEDEALMRSGLRFVLDDRGFEVVGETGRADELPEITRAVEPDVVITDIRMPPAYTDDGLRAALVIRAELPHVGVMVLSQHLMRRYAVELVGDRPEGIGYLLKQRIAAADEFCRDVKRVGAGEMVLDPAVVELMVRRADRDGTSTERLTPRQREVLALIAQGRSNSAIARELVISEKAVVQHTSHIYDELDLPMNDADHRRVLAVIRYLNG